MEMTAGQRLRLLTYMCPEVPVKIFTLVRDSIEEATGLETELIIEDRFKGPIAGRSNPFTENLADIVAMHSTEYLLLKDERQENMELCAAAPVFQHPKADEKAVYFSEIIIHSRNKEKYKTVQNLKGCSWAYNDDKSLSGNLIVLSYLRKELKTNATHFGTLVPSGSHLESIKMVRDARVEAAAVDSTVLAGYLLEHEDHKENLLSIASLGPLPIFPFLFKADLSAELKNKITEGLLKLHTSPKWSKVLFQLGIERFAPVTTDLYMMEQDIREKVKGMTINAAYY